MVVTPPVLAASSLSAASIAAQYNLPSHTALAFPTATLAPTAAVNWLSNSSDWQITKKGHISQPDDVSFVSDPIDNSSSTPVLAIDYPAGSYNGGTGGTSFENYFNASNDTPFQSMLISYQIAFPSGFDFVLGGKLPGLRGGDLNGCSGGELDPSCFSARYMWRQNGQGEAYMYMPKVDAVCSASNVKCNSDGYGTSLARGSFKFQTGTWQNVTMYVAMNNPTNTANGQVAVYYNGVQAFSFSNLQLRSNDSLKGFTGMFFSTFFGGNNASWASPTDQKTYYRNIELYGSTSPSNATGSVVKSSATLLAPVAYTWIVTLIGGVFLL